MTYQNKIWYCIKFRLDCVVHYIELNWCDMLQFALEMDIVEHHKWVYSRLLLGKKGYTNEVLLRFEGFVTYACQ